VALYIHICATPFFTTAGRKKETAKLWKKWKMSNFYWVSTEPAPELCLLSEWKCKYWRALRRQEVGRAWFFRAWVGPDFFGLGSGLIFLGSGRAWFFSGSGRAWASYFGLGRFRAWKFF
jgi:hypothetical protein